MLLLHVVEIKRNTARLLRLCVAVTFLRGTLLTNCIACMCAAKNTVSRKKADPDKSWAPTCKFCNEQGVLTYIYISKCLIFQLSRAKNEVHLI